MRTSKASDAEPAPDQNTDAEPAQTASADTATPPPEATADAMYEPFPGSAFFHGGRHSDIVAAMGRRLEQEGCAPAGKRLGPDWTRAHQHAVAAWQHKLRPKEGGDVSGIPDETAWDKLRVPRVSPLPREA